MKIIISWGDYDLNSGKKITEDENIEMIHKAMKFRSNIVNDIVDLLKQHKLDSFFNVSFDAPSQYELQLLVNSNGTSSHIEFTQDMIDEMYSIITDHLSSWVDTPYVREDDSIVNVDFTTEFKK